MSTQTIVPRQVFELPSIQDPLQRINTGIAELVAENHTAAEDPGAGGITDQDVEGLVQRRDRVLNKLEAVRLAAARQHSSLHRDLEEAWAELRASWARIQRKQGRPTDV